jgi:hypothetical protein
MEPPAYERLFEIGKQQAMMKKELMNRDPEEEALMDCSF